MTQSMVEHLRAVPLLGIHAFGIASGPRLENPATRLGQWRLGGQAAWVAARTAGVTGIQLLQVIATLGGEATRAQIEKQTPGLGADDLDRELSRLAAGELIVLRPDGAAALRPQSENLVHEVAPSMASDHTPITSDALAGICRTLGIKPPMRKQERIDAIADFFADPGNAVRIRAELSGEAWDLLLRIADADLHDDDLYEYAFAARMVHYRPNHLRHDPRIDVLDELMSRGLIGASWDSRLWVWKQAWPVLDRPFFTHWSVPEKPATQQVSPTPARIPRVVADLDRALQVWRAHPPAALKSGHMRLAKTNVRSLAKSLGSPVQAIDLLGRLAMGIGLVRAKIVSKSGRGRNQTIDEVWNPDEQLIAEWNCLTPSQQWLRLLAEWCRPQGDFSEPQVINRHLVLWELANLEPAAGWTNPDQFAEWVAHHYAPEGDKAEALEAVDDLRHLGVIASSGPAGLTELGAAALRDPVAAADIEVGGSTQAIVQADHTVIAPPDLRADVAAWLASIAVLESDAGAFIYRLDPHLLTVAVQAGKTPESILEFLTELSSVPLAANIEWLVRDAAGRAGRIRLISAPTVVVVSDPVDLVTACSVKAAKLRPISDTVAVSELAHPKVQAALERKGLVPEVVLGSAAQPPATPTPALGQPSSAVPGHGPVRKHLLVRDPLALTPDLVDTLGPKER